MQDYHMVQSGEGHGNSLQYFLPREFHGQRSLVGYSPQGHKESDMTGTTQHTYDPAILLLDICPKELKMRSQRDIGHPMFTAALFAIDKKCPLTDE